MSAQPSDHIDRGVRRARLGQEGNAKVRATTVIPEKQPACERRKVTAVTVVNEYDLFA